MPYDDEHAIADLQPSQKALLPGLRLGRIQAVIDGCEEFRAQLLADPMGTMAANMATLTAAERAFIDDSVVRSILTDDIREAVRVSVDGIVDDLVTWPRPFEVDLARVKCPVRAVHGTADDWEPIANLRRILTALGDARLVLFEGFNHFAPLAHPSLVFAMLES